MASAFWFLVGCALINTIPCLLHDELKLDNHTRDAIEKLDQFKYYESNSARKKDLTITGKAISKISGIAQEAMPGEFPYVVRLVFGDEFCGASMFSRIHILTSASCCIRAVKSKKDIYAFVGDHDRTRTDGEQVYLVTGYLKHPQFNTTRNTIMNNICLMLIEGKITVAKETPTHHGQAEEICIPQQRYSPGMMLTVSSWGATFEGDSSRPKKMRKIDIPIVPLDECREVMSKVNKVVPEKSFCAGILGDSKDLCGDDAGSPLVMKNKTAKYCQYLQYGIFSFSHRPCGSKEVYGIYTDVREYIDWLEMHVSYRLRSMLPTKITV